MTSSLVGSEMCIRDSRTCVRAVMRPGGRVREAALTAPDLASTTATTTPVSYTHLTLPTICSV
eukprot:10572367-Prorocentrum_lima.AAC.1